MIAHLIKTTSTIGLALACSAAASAQASAPNPYPTMAPIAKYLMPSEASEIALARAAGPSSISARAEVLVLTKQGYVVRVKGTNGWVCLVTRSWTAGFNDPEFWNWHGVGPACLNPPAAQSILPQYLALTKWAIAGDTLEEIAAKSKAAYADKQFSDPASGSMAFMMSKQQYLLGPDGPWRPHVMPYIAYDQLAAWGVGFKGSPVVGVPLTFRRYQPVTIAIPVFKWSDGSPAPK